VTVAIVQTADALFVVLRVANEELVALFALLSNGVSGAIEANVELIRSSAVGVTRALALSRTVFANVAEITGADSRVNTNSINAAKRTDGQTIRRFLRCFVAVRTFALESTREIFTFLCFIVAIMMIVETFVLW
jgi:hypothetical protein